MSSARNPGMLTLPMAIVIVNYLIRGCECASEPEARVGTRVRPGLDGDPSFFRDDRFVKEVVR